MCPCAHVYRRLRTSRAQPRIRRASETCAKTPIRSNDAPDRCSAFVRLSLSPRTTRGCCQNCRAMPRRPTPRGWPPVTLPTLFRPGHACQGRGVASVPIIRLRVDPATVQRSLSLPDAPVPGTGLLGGVPSAPVRISAPGRFVSGQRIRSDPRECAGLDPCWAEAMWSRRSRAGNCYPTERSRHAHGSLPRGSDLAEQRGGR